MGNAGLPTGPVKGGVETLKSKKSKTRHWYCSRPPVYISYSNHYARPGFLRTDLTVVDFPHLVGGRSKFVRGGSCCNPCLSVAATSVSSISLSCFLQTGNILLYDSEVARTHLFRILRPDVPWTERASRIPSRILLYCQSRAALQIGSTPFLRVQVLTTVRSVDPGWYGRLGRRRNA